jgi:molybdopterin molybdotransferase
MSVEGLSAREAAQLVLGHIEREPALRLPLDDALGSVLADDVVSPLDVPAFANSAMDGYAVRSADVHGASVANPVRLRLIEEIAAGAVPTRVVGPGECSRIFTGAPVPEGANGVIRQEDTDQGTPVVSVTSDRDAGSNVRPAGEDIRKGDIVLRAGTELGPAQLGALASIARAHPLVYRRPRVAILATGDEVVDVDQTEEILSGRKVASSNSHTLNALVRQAGGEPVMLGIAGDDPASIRRHIGTAFDCDLLITTGGVSVGAHDHLRDVIASLGAKLEFWRIRMRPGAPVGFGMLDEIPWIGLPGNPVSTMVTFELLVRPAIRKLMGHDAVFRRAVTVRLTEAVTVKPRLQHFLRAVVTEMGETLEARLAGPQGSGILMSMVRANALLVLPEGQFETPKGAEATAILLDEHRHEATPNF